MVEKGTWRGERLRRTTEAPGDREVVVVWQPLVPEDEDTGFCLDFPAAGLDDLIALLQELKTAAPIEVDAPEVLPALEIVTEDRDEQDE